MFDLLRLARAARTVLGLVGFYRYGWVRRVSFALTCVGLGVAVFGTNVVGVAVVAGGVAGIVTVTRAGYRFADGGPRSGSRAGWHRAS